MAGRPSDVPDAPIGIRRPLVPVALGLVLGVALIGLVALLGSFFGRPPQAPWLCDDTRYVDTVPVGRSVVGPAVSAPPGCAGLGRTSE
ncbi:MAG: hypothetical protein IT305_00555 [Chloroflexi bacterium]|nr:hypothetical protein [Chloroflexota bacterium]